MPILNVNLGGKRNKITRRLKLVFQIVFIANFALNQFLLPFSAAFAESPSENESSKLSTPESEAKSEENSESPDTEKEDLWKSCNVDKLIDKLNDLGKDEDCNKCKKKPTCEEIKECLKAKINLENKAKIENDLNSQANSGKSNITIEENVKQQDQIDGKDSNDQSINDSDNQQNDREENKNGSYLLLPSDNNENTADSADSASENDKNLADSPADDKNNDSNVAEPPAGSLDAQNESNEQESNTNVSFDENAGSDLAVISTGDANADSSVVNSANINSFGENGFHSISLIEGDYDSDINLLEIFSSLIENSSGDQANPSQSYPGTIELSIKNEADIENSLESAANTGENSIKNENPNGNSLIETGNASAFSTAVNIVNTNLIGNNFLFTIINIFGNWTGDLIVPGPGLLSVAKTLFLENLNTLEFSNKADVANNLKSNADSGKNTIEGSSENALIETGASTAENVVLNYVGNTIVKNNWFFLVINNMGRWTGQILNWDNSGESFKNIFSFDFDEVDNLPGATFGSWLSRLFIQNEAEVENNLTSIATTGGNEIENEGGSAIIKTGNATAVNRVYNFINNNFIGSNWMFTMVNIFGNWKGDVEFAYPDLSIDISANTQKVKNGDEYAYSIKYANQGRAKCRNINLALKIPQHTNLSETSISPSSSDTAERNLIWTLPELNPGESGAINLKLLVAPAIPETTTALTATAEIAAETKEINLNNNRASSNIGVYRLAISDSDSKDENKNQNTDANLPAQEIKNSALAISRSVSDKNIRVGEATQHKIIVRNTGEQTIYDIDVADKVRNRKGNAGEYHWNVKKLNPGQKATISYYLMVNLGAPDGKYANTALAIGTDENNQKVESNKAKISINAKYLLNQYYGYYYTNPQIPPTAIMSQELNEAIPAAEAATADDELAPEKVLGAWSQKDTCQTLPWWNWLAIAVLYLAVIHWLLIRQKNRAN